MGGDPGRRVAGPCGHLQERTQGDGSKCEGLGEKARGHVCGAAGRPAGSRVREAREQRGSPGGGSLTVVERTWTGTPTCEPLDTRWCCFPKTVSTAVGRRYNGGWRANAGRSVRKLPE